MKHIRKLFCLLLALTMVLSLGMAASAQEVTVGGGSGSITVTNPTAGKEYALFKLFDATYNENDGVAYTFTRTDANEALFNLLSAEESPFLLEQVLDSAVYNVTLRENKTGSDVSTWVKDNLLTANEDGVLVPNDILAPVATAVAETAEGDESNTLKFSGLDYGYYFLTSTLGATITLTSNTPDQNIIDKNQGPSWDVDEQGTGKVITSDSNKDYTGVDEDGNPIPGTTENAVNVGDTVHFQIGVNTTNYNGDKPITEYRIYDSLAEGFDYQQDTLKVWIGDKELTLAASFDEAVVGENFCVVWSEEANAFVIRVPWYVAPAEEGGDPTFASAEAANVIRVEYDAILNAVPETVYAGEANLNKAIYDFLDTTDEPDEPDPENPQPHHTVEEKTTKTYTFALGLVKVDGETKDRLKGAEFRVQYDEEKDGVTTTYYLIATKEADGSYVYQGKTTDPDQATVFGTDDNGQLLIRGVNEGSYQIVETKAPDGYNTLLEPITLTAEIASASEYTTTYTTYYDEEGNVVDTEVEEGTVVTREYEVNVAECIVENNQGTTFPETGGTGVKIFYLLGGILAVGAVILLVTRKRVRNFE